jgi:hypothetical protein
VSSAVEPLRAAFLAEVRAEVARALADADRRAAARIAEAERRGRALVEAARAEGVAVAALVGAEEQTLARRRAQSLRLAAKRELYERLAAEAHAAARALRNDPRYPALLARLAQTARAQLGADAVLELDPPEAGGVRACAGSRRVDYTLDALAERCLERLGSEMERLWA